MREPQSKDVWALARELAEAIEQSPQLQAFRRTEDALLSDDEALLLIQEYEARKRAVKSSRDKSKEEQQGLIHRFLEVEERFKSHAGIQAHWKARIDLDAFLDRINTVVTFPITGQQEPKPQGGCGSGGCGCTG